MDPNAAPSAPQASPAPVATRPPPLAPGRMVLGNAVEFLQNRGGLLARLYQQLGPVFRIRLGPQEVTVMAGPELIHFATRDAGRLLRSGPVAAAFVGEFGGTNLLLGADLEPHFHRRKQLMPQFTPRAVMAAVPRLSELAREAALGWTPGRSLDLVDALKRLTTRQAGLVLAGRSAEHIHDDICTYVDRAVAVCAGGYLPRIALKTPGYLAAKNRVLSFCRALVAERRAMPKEARPGDLIDLIVDGAEADGTPVDEGEVAGLVVLPFAAGLDTVAHTNAFLLHELLANPALLARCVAEADSVFTDGVLDPTKLRGLDTLSAAVTETLRRYPMADVNQREAAETFDFEGYRIEQGTRLMLATTVSHYLPKFFPDPWKFDADRCRAPRNEHLQPHAFTAFGAGPHKCIGNKLAEVQLLITTATLLHTVRFERDPADYTLRMSSFPALKPKGLRVRPVARA